MPPPPQEYLLYLWRKQWPSETWLSARLTPIQGIYNDFDMNGIENDHADMRAQLKKNQKQNVT